MTKQEAIAAHRKMWNWIADETEWRERAVHKYDYFNAMDIPEDKRPHFDCYCCEYACRRNGADCSLCPLEWSTGRCDNDGLYSQWYIETSFRGGRGGDWRKAAAIAREIANLPEK